MIVIDLRAFFRRELGFVPIVRVVMQQTDRYVRQRLEDAPDDRRLPGAASTGDAENERAPGAHAHRSRLFSFSARWTASFSTHGLRSK